MPEYAEPAGATRPRRLVVVTGTGTEVGKTWVTAERAAAFRRRGWRVAARKPVQSYSPGDERTDAKVLAEATGEHPDVVCPPWRRYPLPMAPPMAAQALGRPGFTVAALADEVVASWPTPPVDVGLVEGAGGVASPLADDGDTAALVAALAPDVVVVVSGPELGAINLVRLSVRALKGVPVLVYLNRFDDANELHRRNRDWLVKREGYVVKTAASWPSR
jgi:dethiobiotin synthetase